MTHSVAEILKQALRLPPEARAAVAGILLDSIDQTMDSEAEAAWEEEVLVRLQEIDEGRVKLVPWAEARRSIAGT